MGEVFRTGMLILGVILQFAGFVEFLIDIGWKDALAFFVILLVFGTIVFGVVACADHSGDGFDYSEQHTVASARGAARDILGAWSNEHAKSLTTYFVSVLPSCASKMRALTN
jgi:hypothetical protein